jgi:hypothetical protein
VVVDNSFVSIERPINRQVCRIVIEEQERDHVEIVDAKRHGIVEWPHILYGILHGGTPGPLIEGLPRSLRRLLMEMFNPPHPGEIIREDCLKPLNLSVKAAAKWLVHRF